MQPLFFFVLAAVIFKVATAPLPVNTAPLVPGLLWVMTLLASMLAVEGCFEEDARDGSLALGLLASSHPYWLALGSILSRCLCGVIPLIAGAALFALALEMPLAVLPVAVLAVALGSVSLIAIGALAASLLISLRRGGLMLALLALPLSVPTLVFGSASIARANLGLSWQEPMLALLGLVFLSLCLAPLGVAAAWRLSV